MHKKGATFGQARLCELLTCPVEVGDIPGRLEDSLAQRVKREVEDPRKAFFT